ncbi:GTPase activating protein homolog 4 [Pleuronectes platessa]|uniref:GTPase activating protein homolog 4 n=1 Tax=Pleuronectes platessa TaxID=8262 RepID=UPI00232A3F70|nr:GTPase activating protein homolog 4 [Pleuronectes platessa]
MQQPDVVMSLRIELLRANKKIMALKYGTESLRERMWQLENQLKDRDDVIKMAVEKEKDKEKEKEKEVETEMEKEKQKQKEIQALKEKVEQLENQLKDKDDMIKMAVEKEKEKETETETEKEKEKEKEIQLLKEKVEQ